MRPGQGERPSQGDLSDFLGLDRPGAGGGRPGGADTLPGFVDNRPVSRPGQGGAGTQFRPGDRPDNGLVNRPGQGGAGERFRPGEGRPFERPGQNRPINIGNDITIGGNTNNIINNRPTWSNISDSAIGSLNNNWQNAIGTRPGMPGLGNWLSDHPDRGGYWNGWADGVRHGWNDHGWHDHWFNNDWWAHHDHGLCGWHYGYGFHNHNYNYWWTVPAWGAFNTWFNWSAAPSYWSQPVYYDYGSGGNVVYEGDTVYIAGEQVASASDFAQSAAALATVPPPETEEQAAESEWMALGTFAISAAEQDTDPKRVMQLAVNKDGIISGTLYNTETDQTQTVQGQVDKTTQRVAFRIGESDTIVAETGLYNLTKDEAPVLVHFGEEKTENYLLVRLTQPEEAAAGESPTN